MLVIVPPKNNSNTRSSAANTGVAYDVAKLAVTGITTVTAVAPDPAITEVNAALDATPSGTAMADTIKDTTGPRAANAGVGDAAQGSRGSWLFGPKRALRSPRHRCGQGPCRFHRGDHHDHGQ